MIGEDKTRIYVTLYKEDLQILDHVIETGSAPNRSKAAALLFCLGWQQFSKDHPIDSESEECLKRLTTTPKKPAIDVSGLTPAQIKSVKEYAAFIRAKGGAKTEGEADPE